MRKFLLLIILLVVPQNLFGHASHYKNYKKIEMNIFKDGKKLDIVIIYLIKKMDF